MDMAEELEQLRTINRRINALVAQSERLEKCLKFANNSRSVVTMSNKLVATCASINQEIDNLYDSKSYILELIETLDGEEKDIIKCYYINGQSWEQVSQTTFQSLRTVYRIRKTAIKKLQDLVS